MAQVREAFNRIKQTSVSWPISPGNSEEAESYASLKKNSSPGDNLTDDIPISSTGSRPNGLLRNQELIVGLILRSPAAAWHAPAPGRGPRGAGCRSGAAF